MKIPDYIDCAPEYRASDVAYRFTICNGCGAAGAKFDFVPDSILGLSIKDACFPHDWDYHFGKTLEDKRRGDARFLTNMMEIINRNKAFWFLKWRRRRHALTYYNFVCDMGEKAFWSGKTKPDSSKAGK